MIKTIVTLVAIGALPLSQAFAWGGKHGAKEVKLLNDSVAALQPVNPDLAGRLKQFAAKEATEKESAEMAESKAQQQQDIQLLRESSDALKPSRPDLAKGLDRFADKETRMMKRAVSPAHRHRPTQAPSGQGY